MTTYNILKTVNGQRTGQVIAERKTMQDAREELYSTLKYTECDNGDWNYFDNPTDICHEIRWAEDSREDWGNERVDAYIAALEEGKSTELPFMANSVTGECVTIQDDEFHYDNYKVQICRIVIDNPFDLIRYYPTLIMDEQGNNRMVEYVEGSNLEETEYWGEFYELPIILQDEIIANTKDEDKNATINGSVYRNPEATIWAILYNEEA